MDIQPDTSHTARKRDRFVLAALARRFGPERIASSGLSVLDLGCGCGNLAEALGRAGLGGVLGIDIDPPSIAHARKRCGRFGHRFEVMAIEEFDSAPVFDAVVISDVLMCLADPAATLRALRRWVQPGGLAIIAIPNGFGPWALYRSAVERRRGAGPGGSAVGRHRFTAKGLAGLIRAAGFRIEAWGRSSFLSAVYPFSVSRYRSERWGFIERWDVSLADILPRSLASGWHISLRPAPVPASAIAASSVLAQGTVLAASRAPRRPRASLGTSR